MYTKTFVLTWTRVSNSLSFHTESAACWFIVTNVNKWHQRWHFRVECRAENKCVEMEEVRNKMNNSVELDYQQPYLSQLFCQNIPEFSLFLFDFHGYFIFSLLQEHFTLFVVTKATDWRVNLKKKQKFAMEEIQARNQATNSLRRPGEIWV